MKINFKAITIIAISALIISGCAKNTVNETVNSSEQTSTSSAQSSSSAEQASSSAEQVSSSAEQISSSTEQASSSSVEESSSSEQSSSFSEDNSTSSKPISSSSKPISSSSKPVSSSSKPALSSSKPASSSSKPVSSSSKPASSSSKPVEIPTHNCKNDGHIWNKTYTESSTENVEIVELHDVSNCGYDFDLAYRYFGRASWDVDLRDYLDGVVFGSGSSKVKTTGIKTITRFIHECSECGYKETYNTEETVTPDDNWVFVNGSRSKNDYCSVIWYDINNIPDEVYEGVENLLADREAWKNSLRNSR